MYYAVTGPQPNYPLPGQKQWHVPPTYKTYRVITIPESIAKAMGIDNAPKVPSTPETQTNPNESMILAGEESTTYRLVRTPHIHLVKKIELKYFPKAPDKNTLTLHTRGTMRSEQVWDESIQREVKRLDRRGFGLEELI